MFSQYRIQLATGAALLVMLVWHVSIATTQSPTPTPPKAKRPASPQSRPAPAQPITNGPSVQLVSPTNDAASAPASGNAPGNEVRIATPADDPFPVPPAQPPRPATGDPTIPSPEVRQMLEAGNANRTNNNSQPAASPSLPAMSIKARIISNRKQPVAVIDVGGTPLTIHLGDTFSIGGGQSASALRLKVVELNQTEIRFEVENRRQILTLN